MKNRELFHEYAKDILESERFAVCREFIQHGTISVYTHSLEVASLSFSMACILRESPFGRGMDLRSLVRAALLHDFFLYDWHTPEKMWSLHGWTHPVTAAKNARKMFAASEKECSLIRTHMWPYTLLHPPQYPEGWIICFADKICSLRETLFCRKKIWFWEKKAPDVIGRRGSIPRGLPRINSLPLKKL
ncbi:MAG: HD domain-containing protein [Treponema sp.]|jgi:uncharacterized protein|nr:HD domain-containing protein [Treponema sp.]